MRTSRTRMFAALGACVAVVAGPLAAPAAAAPDDLRRDQWGLEAVGAAQAWEETRGSGVTVAVLDTGVRDDHPDLGDVTVGPDLTGLDTAADAEHHGRHGTMMAGIVAASGHGVEHTGGVLGVAPEARILSVRVAPEEDDPRRDEADPGALAAGINHAVAEGAQVISIPLADADLRAQPDPKEREAVRHALGNGVVVVASGGFGTEPLYPAAYEGVLAVGAVASDDGTLADFSSRAEHVALVAPGEEITVLHPEEGYSTVSGSDAAAAFVSGVAALVRAQHPQLRPEQVTEALTTGTVPSAAVAEPGHGAGIAHAPGALAAAGQTAEDVPPFDPRLAEELTDEPLVPVWALWAGGAVLAVAAAVVGIVVLRRRTANPYDLPEREPRRRETETRAPMRGRRRKGRGRRRVTR